MKVRLGFVSNSSSSSFAICLDKLSEDQIKKIVEFVKSDECLGTEENDYDGDSEWYIHVNRKAGILHGSNSETYGDKLFTYMKKIGIKNDFIASME